jgi:RNA polymerase sigma factor (sigma-70 family)
MVDANKRDHDRLEVETPASNAKSRSNKINGGQPGLPQITDIDSESEYEIDVDEKVIELLFSTKENTRNSRSGSMSTFQRNADRFVPLNSEEQLAIHRLYLKGEEAKKNLLEGKVRKNNKEVQALILQGEKAMEHLCASCWKLAWLLVREAAEPRYGKEKASEMIPDLMGEANAALVASVKEFDPSKTPKFHTYAARRIRDHLRVVISKDSYIQVAPSWNRVKRMAVTLTPELTLKLGHQPSTKELQDALLEQCLSWADDHLTVEQKTLPEDLRMQARLTKLRKQGMLGAIRDIEEVLVATQNVASLDAPVNSDDGAASLGDLLKSSDSHLEYNNVEHKELSTAIYAALATLSDRERDIIMLRNGFAVPGLEDDNEEWTYNRIADRHQVTAERIRQIEKTALSKLASPHGQFAGLSNFLDN